MRRTYLHLGVMRCKVTRLHLITQNETFDLHDGFVVFLQVADDRLFIFRSVRAFRIRVVVLKAQAPSPEQLIEQIFGKRGLQPDRRRNKWYLSSQPMEILLDRFLKSRAFQIATAMKTVYLYTSWNQLLTNISMNEGTSLTTSVRINRSCFFDRFLRR